MVLDINMQLEENPHIIPVVNFLDPKFGGVPPPSTAPATAEGVAVGGGDIKAKSPLQQRKHSQPHTGEYTAQVGGWLLSVCCGYYLFWCSYREKLHCG